MGLIICRASRNLSSQAGSEGTEEPEGPWTRRSVSCLACGYSAHVPRSDGDRMTITLGGSGDAYFGLPLWLTTECRGRVLRERGSLPGSMSMAGRLPAWIKDAEHRDDVVSAIRRLRVMAAGQSEP